MGFSCRLLWVLPMPCSVSWTWPVSDICIRDVGGVCVGVVVVVVTSSFYLCRVHADIGLSMELRLSC